MKYFYEVAVAAAVAVAVADAVADAVAAAVAVGNEILMEKDANENWE